jgi:hypothetical protein
MQAGAKAAVYFKITCITNVTTLLHTSQYCMDFITINFTSQNRHAQCNIEITSYQKMDMKIVTTCGYPG